MPECILKPILFSPTPKFYFQNQYCDEQAHYQGAQLKKGCNQKIKNGIGSRFVNNKNFQT
jgi:hypothetical protein